MRNLAARVNGLPPPYPPKVPIVSFLNLYCMPLTDLINQHYTAAEITAINNAVNALQTALVPKARNITPEERKQYGSINEQNKLLVQKVRDYRTNQPGMASPDVDWAEFEADYQDRNFLEALLARLTTLAEIASDTKILHDYDVYQASLMDYDYTKYKMGTNAVGYDSKHDDIKQFFPNTGGGGGGSSSSAPTT